MKYLIANWKAQMTYNQVQEWIRQCKQILAEDIIIKRNGDNNNLTIIICPPHQFILYVKEQLKDISFIQIGAQDISHIEEGKFTGEVTAKALQGIIDFAIIGHSERRSNFEESEEIISQKIAQCVTYGIKPILCVRDQNDIMYSDVSLVAYEPVSAIGTGHNMNPQEVIEMKKQLSLSSDVQFFYGGSADEKNCKEYLQTDNIDGFLVGSASLDAKRFLEMAQNCI